MGIPAKPTTKPDVVEMENIVVIQNAIRIIPKSTPESSGNNQDDDWEDEKPSHTNKPIPKKPEDT